MARSKPGNGKTRRPKPVNQGRRATLRYGDEVANAVDQLQREVAKSRGIPLHRTDDAGVPLYTKALDFSKAIRMLVVENERAARIMAGSPSSWPTSSQVELPEAFWSALDEVRNRQSHAQGSLYQIARKLNFDAGPVAREEFVAAFHTLRSCQESLAQLVALARAIESKGEAEAA